MRGHHTEETKRKISESTRGRIPPNKGITGVVHLSDETRKKMSEARKSNPNRYWKGKKKPPLTENHKQKIRLGHLGKPRSLETRLKLSKANLGKRKYLLDRRNELRRAREQIDYRLWQLSVWERDEFRCKKCKQFSNKLRAHHVLSFVLFPELRYSVDNGVTLCEGCHFKLHSEFGKLHKNRQFTEEFLKN